MTSDRSGFDAQARSLSGDEPIHNGQFLADWYVYWWRRDGTAHGSQGHGLTLAAATRLAGEVRDGKFTPPYGRRRVES